MKITKLSLILLGSAGLLFLGACTSNNQETNSSNNPVNSSHISTQPTESTTQENTEAKAANHAAVPQAGGQVVESGSYHLEFLSEPEAEGTHLDLYLQQGGNHEAIPNAKVTAQVQLPDGTQKTIPLSYDVEGKHYTTMLPGNASGQHQVKITSDINGEKVDGRFSFNR